MYLGKLIALNYMYNVHSFFQNEKPSFALMHWHLSGCLYLNSAEVYN
jgi:hypothetical protein